MCPLVYVLLDSSSWVLEGRDGWDQGTTGTDRYIGSFGGPQPAVLGAEMDRCVVKST